MQRMMVMAMLLELWMVIQRMMVMAMLLELWMVMRRMMGMSIQMVVLLKMRTRRYAPSRSPRSRSIANKGVVVVYMDVQWSCVFGVALRAKKAEKSHGNKSSSSI